MLDALIKNNFLLINKPAGWTSFDVVAYVRQHVRNHPERPRLAAEESKDPLTYGSANQRDSTATARAGVYPERTERVERAQNDSEKKPRIKVGHAGTLDPFATGLLIVGVGREATKRLDEFKNLPKTYVATIHLGATSDTYDRTGTIQSATYPHPYPPPNRGRTQEGVNNETIEQFNNLAPPTRTVIGSILTSFLGKQLQIPPMFSAKKVNGQRLYKLARQGKIIERKPNEIEIYKIYVVEYVYPLLKIEITCSAGTYIRSLAHDIGEKLKVGAYCEELVRTKIGDYNIHNAHDLTQLDGLLKN